MNDDIDMIVRRMLVNDLPQVQLIDEISFSSPWTKDAFRFELLVNPNGHCWVAELDEKLVGFIVCWLIIDEAHIATLAVHPAYRGQNISKALVIRSLGELIDRGALTVTLEVRAWNKVAQGLYRHFGFQQVGLRKSYYKDTQEDAVLMTAEPLDTNYLAWLNAGAEKPWFGKQPA